MEDISLHGTLIVPISRKTRPEMFFQTKQDAVITCLGADRLHTSECLILEPTLSGNCGLITEIRTNVVESNLLEALAL